jgi:hypothetical protein
MRWTIASSISGTPCPVFAETISASVASSPIVSSICCWTHSGRATGRSILLSTGTIARSLSSAT